MERMLCLYRRKRRFLRLIYMLASGVFAGLLESESLPAFFCLISMLPLFTALCCESRRELTLRLLPFLGAYDLTKTGFLLNVYSNLDMPRAAGLLCSLFAAIGTALILLVSQIVCLSFFCGVRTGKARDAVSLALLFSASEWLCENIGPISFPWLGVWAQAENAPPLLMTAKLFGCRFTSFVILSLNGMIFLAAKAVGNRNAVSLAKCAVCFAAVTGITAVYGAQETAALRSAAEKAPKLNVLTVQLDCEGREKSKLTAVEAAERYLELIEKGCGKCADGADVVFLPETAVHTSYGSGEAFDGLEEFAAKHGCTIVTGCFFKESGKKYNSVIAISPEGSSERVYSKAHLVPFGEYIPFSGLFGGGGLSARHEECEPAEICGTSIGCGICIESIYSDLFRSQVRKGARLIYIPTNDSWFGDSYARHAHYLHSKIRAVENSRYSVRAGNCGISAVTAPWGENIAEDESKECGFLTAEVSLLEEKSVYSVVGDAFILIPLSLVILSGVNGAKRRLRNRTQA